MPFLQWQQSSPMPITNNISKFTALGKIATIALLCGFAIAGNILSLPLVFGVDLIFGSIFVVVTLILFGSLPAIIVAVTAGSYTLLLWGHPYALIIFTAEAVVLSQLHRRNWGNIVLADLSYWVCLGIPLVFLFYHSVLGIGWETTTSIALKQMVNGVYNTLIASLLLLALQLSKLKRIQRIKSLPLPKLNDVFFYILLTTLLLTGVSAIIYEAHNLRTHEEDLLAVRLTQKSKQLSKLLQAEPSASRERLKTLLTQSIEDLDTSITLHDNSEKVKIHSGLGQKDTISYEKIELDNQLIFLLPKLNVPALERWRSGRYQITTPLHQPNKTVNITITVSAKSVANEVEARRLTQFILLSALLASAILVSRLLSTLLTKPLTELQSASHALIMQIESGSLPKLPNHTILEYDNLKNTLLEMSVILATNFTKLRRTQYELENQVESRSDELNRFKTILDQTLDCVFMFDATSLKFFYVNAGAITSIGYSQEELLNMQPQQVTAKTNLVEFKNIINPLLNGEKASLTYETEHKHKDGKCIPVEVFLQYVVQDDKKPLFISIVRDISERKKNETILAEANQRLRLAADAAGFGVWEWNLIENELVWDDWMFRLYGIKRVDFKNAYEAWEATLHPDDKQHAVDELTLAIDGKKDFDTEFRAITPEGKTRTIKAAGLVLRDANNKALRMIGVSYDITSRVNAELALQKSVAQLQAILDNIVDSIITIDQHGIITSANRATLKIFGYKTEELLGNNVKMLMPNPYRDNHDSYLRNYQKTKIRRIIGIGREVEGQKKDGTQFPMELVVSEVKHQGEPIYVGMVRDITERKKVEQIKGEFVSTVSHELRTPLTAISAALGLIIGNTNNALTTQQVDEMITIAHSNSKRLATLIDDLLDIEKITAGKLHFDLKSYSLTGLIKQALETNHSYGIEHNITLKLTDAQADVLVWVDWHRLMQVLSNLISNAVKYSPEGDTVKISITTSKESVRVTVIDNGPGVPKDFHSRIFEKFSQADSSDTRKVGGTGLGLAISKELIELMDGTIGFHSIEKEGASFFFDLPVHTQKQPDINSSGSVHPARTELPILILEDVHATAYLLSLIFIKAGYTTEIVLTAKDALSALSENNYAALSLDLKLPDMPGLQLLAEVRASHKNTNLPIVVVSANFDEGIISEINNFKYVSYTRKPVDPQYLLKIVEKLINQTSTLEHSK